MRPLPHRHSLKQSDISVSMAMNFGRRGTGDCAGISPVVALFAGDRKSQDCRCRPLLSGKSTLRSRRAGRKSGTEHPEKVKPRKAFEALRGFVRWKIGGSCGDRTCDSLLKRHRANTITDYNNTIFLYLNVPNVPYLAFCHPPLCAQGHIHLRPSGQSFLPSASLLIEVTGFADRPDFRR